MPNILLPTISPRALLLALCLLPATLPSAQAASEEAAPPADAAAIRAGKDAPPPPMISDEILQQEYAEYRKSVEGMKMYTVRYILIKDEADAKGVLARLRTGDDFGRNAREHSQHQDSAGQDGLLGTFASCRWAKDTLAMLDSLKPGQIHPKPVKASAGWGIYRLDRVEPLVPVSFQSYKTQLLSGSFKPECPWVAPVTVGVPAPR